MFLSPPSSPVTPPFIPAVAESSRSPDPEKTPEIVRSAPGVDNDDAETETGHSERSPWGFDAKTAYWLRQDTLIATHRIHPSIHLRKYDPADDELPPLRAGGETLKITGISSHSIDGTTSNKDVKPFLRNSISKEARRALTEAHLRVEKFTEADLHSVESEKQRRCEECLVGQEKVVAAHDLREGICVGVLSGEIYHFNGRGPRPARVSDDMVRRSLHYAIPAGTTAEGQSQNILTAGILSKINSIFEYEPDDRCDSSSVFGDSHHYAEAASGYNLQAKKFLVKTDSKQHPDVEMTALFTTEAIKQGRELRFRYDRAPLGIRLCLRGLQQDVGFRR